MTPDPTPAEMLAALCERSQERGWPGIALRTSSYLGYSRVGYFTREQGGHQPIAEDWITDGLAPLILFDHGFAKTVYGDEEVEYEVDCEALDGSYQVYETAHSPAWVLRLEQIVMHESIEERILAAWKIVFSAGG